MTPQTNSYEKLTLSLFFQVLPSNILWVGVFCNLPRTTRLGCSELFSRCAPIPTEPLDGCCQLYVSLPRAMLDNLPIDAQLPRHRSQSLCPSVPPSFHFHHQFLILCDHLINYCCYYYYYYYYYYHHHYYYYRLVTPYTVLLGDIKSTIM